mgnify:CR=1 FL=1
MDEFTSGKHKIAVFIDADNAPASKIDFILAELAKYGVVNIRKAYGNWTNTNLKGWTNLLHEFAIQPMQQFDLTKGKNATDIALVIDVMDVLYTKQVDIICLVSSDCDFTPLVTRMLADGEADRHVVSVEHHLVGIAARRERLDRLARRLIAALEDEASDPFEVRDGQDVVERGGQQRGGDANELLAKNSTAAAISPASSRTDLSPAVPKNPQIALACR